MARIRGSALASSAALEGWAIARCDADAARPEDLPESLEWLEIPEPMPVAAALRHHGRWSLDETRAFDAETWWYRARLPGLPPEAAARDILELDGIATVADVFLDRRHVLRSESMFHEHRLPFSSERELLVRVAPLAETLAQKRPRPRWKTKLVSHQQLRFVRTSLVGRMPGWSPPAPPVGLWRPARAVRWRRFVAEDVDLRVERDEVKVALRGSSVGGEAVTEAVLVVGEGRGALTLRSDGAEGSVRIRDARPWWPHTHGDSPRYPARIELVIGGAAHAIDLGSVAFRTVELDTACPSREGFALRVNGTPVFCRGASWTTLDVATLGGTPADYMRVLGAMKHAGMNMVRLSGTMFYEADAFYDACDELGILVWQDFMFANMDYPIDDEAFRASVAREAAQVTRRLQARPCLAVLCGGSEVEQQAAMFGADPAVWKSRLFDEVLREASASLCPDVPYWPNTPSGGALPFHVDCGVAHYYGVGAYLRPLDDARRANVRFAAECLAFANVPEEDLFASILRPGEAPIVSARWKERTSKDHGATWDFEDVRDYYLRLLFGGDPARLRYEDPDRYLALSRVTTGEVMARTLAEFRRAGSTCAGALVWFLQDLWPGAGWGILDSRGQPKSPFWFLRRVLQPVAAFITDEGQSGLHLHVVNDGPADLAARLSFTLYRSGESITCAGKADVVAPARSAIAIAGDGVLGCFTDSSRAYRFGPPGHDVAHLELTAPGDELLAEAFHLPDFGAPPPCVGLEASLAKSNADTWTLTVQTRTFAQAVAIHVPGYIAEDNYFDLAPGRRREIVLRPAGTPTSRTPRGEVKALNAASAVDVGL